MKIVVFAEDSRTQNYVESVSEAVCSAARHDPSAAHVLVFMDRAFELEDVPSSVLGVTISRRVFDLRTGHPPLLEALWKFKNESWGASVFFMKSGLPYYHRNQIYFTHNLAHELEHARFFCADPAAYHLGSFVRDSWQEMYPGTNPLWLEFPDEAECERIGKAAGVAIHGIAPYEETIRARIIKSKSNSVLLPIMRNLLQMDCNTPPTNVRHELIRFIESRTGLRENLLARWDRLRLDPEKERYALIAEELPLLLGP